MGNDLSRISPESFRSEIRALAESERSAQSALNLDDELIQKLWVHYEETCRWNPRLSLIGPGTGQEVIRRHYWESLEGLDFLRKEDRRLVDLGSGGGFPGWVLSAAAPDLDVRLVEPREKKWAFLRTTIRKAGLLSCTAVNARVEAPLPPELDWSEATDVVTSRALAVSAEILDAIAERSPRVRFLFWVGKEEIDLPQGYRAQRSKRLPGSRYRRIIEITRSP